MAQSGVVYCLMTIYEESLEYHSRGRKGKIEVVPTKPVSTQHDLSLAYSPGVAEPCRMIAEKEELAYEYTAKGNLVGVVTNGISIDIRFRILDGNNRNPNSKLGR